MRVFHQPLPGRSAERQGLRERVRARLLVPPRRGAGGRGVPQHEALLSRTRRRGEDAQDKEGEETQREHAAHSRSRAVLHRERGQFYVRQISRICKAESSSSSPF